jgi:hypothetical protein
MLLSAGRVWRRVITVAAITAMFLVVFQPIAAQAVSCTHHPYPPFETSNSRVIAHVITNCTSSVKLIHTVGQVWRVTSGPDAKVGEQISNCTGNVCDAWPTGPCARGPHGYYTKARGYYILNSSSPPVTITPKSTVAYGITC